MTPKHYLTTTSTSHDSQTTYRAICGYESTNPKEFTSIANPSTKGTTCSGCLDKISHAFFIMAKIGQR